jgi:hypothetical protein
MLIALVLLCSIEVTPDLQDCTEHNATAVLRVPGEFAQVRAPADGGHDTRARQAYLGPVVSLLS